MLSTVSGFFSLAREVTRPIRGSRKKRKRPSWQKSRAGNPDDKMGMDWELPAKLLVLQFFE